MNIYKLFTATLLVATFLAMPLFMQPVQAQTNVTNLLWGNGVTTNALNDVNLGSKDPRAIAVQVIKVLLGFLGLIAVVIIMLGGFKWMTAGGNEDQIAEAKNLMVAGAVGLIIILASYGLAGFIVNMAINATA